MKRGLLIVFLATAASSVAAKVMVMGLRQMVAESDLIVLARVEKVVREVRLQKELFEQASPDIVHIVRDALSESYATARPMETWKGKPVETVEYLASPTWTCDVSRAARGEVVVLFLKKDPKLKTYVIVNSGYGRAPLRRRDASWVSTWPWREEVPLDDLRRQVRELSACSSCRVRP